MIITLRFYQWTWAIMLNIPLKMLNVWIFSHRGLILKVRKHAWRPLLVNILLLFFISHLFWDVVWVLPIKHWVIVPLRVRPVSQSPSLNFDLVSDKFSGFLGCIWSIRRWDSGLLTANCFIINGVYFRYNLTLPLRFVKQALLYKFRIYFYVVMVTFHVHNLRWLHTLVLLAPQLKLFWIVHFKGALRDVQHGNPLLWLVQLANKLVEVKLLGHQKTSTWNYWCRLDQLVAQIKVAVQLQLAWDGGYTAIY